MAITRRQLRQIIQEELEKPILYELRIYENDDFLMLIHGGKAMEECQQISKQHIVKRIQDAYVNNPPWPQLNWRILSVYWNPKKKQIYRKIKDTGSIAEWQS
jgi:hypothetical protein